jgi:hypothetical protein
MSLEKLEVRVWDGNRVRDGPRAIESVDVDDGVAVTVGVYPTLADSLGLFRGPLRTVSDADLVKVELSELLLDGLVVPGVLDMEPVSAALGELNVIVCV